MVGSKFFCSVPPLIWHATSALHFCILIKCVLSGEATPFQPVESAYFPRYEFDLDIDAAPTTAKCLGFYALNYR